MARRKRKPSQSGTAGAAEHGAPQSYAEAASAPQPAAPPCSAEPLEETESSKLRERGNVVYKHAVNFTKTSLKAGKLAEAMSLYEDALQCAESPTDRAKAARNLAVVNAATFVNNQDREIFDGGFKFVSLSVSLGLTALAQCASAALNSRWRASFLWRQTPADNEINKDSLLPAQFRCCRPGALASSVDQRPLFKEALDCLQTRQPPASECCDEIPFV